MMTKLKFILLTFILAFLVGCNSAKKEKKTGIVVIPADSAVTSAPTISYSGATGTSGNGGAPMSVSPHYTHRQWVLNH